MKKFIRTVSSAFGLLSQDKDENNEKNRTFGEKGLKRQKKLEVENSNSSFDKKEPVSKILLGEKDLQGMFGKIDSYVKTVVLGEGTYAKVFKGYSKILQADVAIKELKYDKNEGASCTTLREVSILRELNHTNIVCLHDIVYFDHLMYLIFEYLPFDLTRLLKQYKKSIPTNDSIIFTFQLLKGLNYCHSKEIIHRDLKPPNILINHKGILKLADFGLARSLVIPTKMLSSNVVTLWYRPPEALLGATSYNFSLDMWSVGCIIYEIFTKKVLFAGKDWSNQLYLIKLKLGELTESNLPGLKNLPKYKKTVLHQVSINNHRVLGFHEKRISNSVAILLSKLLVYNSSERVDCLTLLKYDCFNLLNEKISALQMSNLNNSEKSAQLLSHEFRDIVKNTINL